MKLFGRLTGRDQFPEEGNDGTVQIVGDKVICEGNHGLYSCEVNIGNIQYAYVVVNGNRQSFLFLFDFHQHFIPTSYKGFKSVYQGLSKKFGFDDALFFENVNREAELKQEIWRRTYEPTYEISSGDHRDYEEGFEILSPRRPLISWDTTYDELAKSESAIFEKSPYGQKIVKFKYPVRIGKVILRDFGVHYGEARTDVPVKNFFAKCFDRHGTDKSYNDLKGTFASDIGTGKNQYGYERPDQKNISFGIGGMIFSICYTYDSKWQFDGGYTALSVENRRTYERLLIDIGYEEKMSISDYLILRGKVGISDDYRRNEKVKRRQNKLTEKFRNEAVIWTDDVNNKIGFSSGSYSQVYEKDEIKSFCIQNILPAKGGGAGRLELSLANEKHQYAIFTGECHFFDKYAEDIKALTNKDLTFGQPYHDC